MLNDITTGEVKLDDAIPGKKISDDLPVIDGIEWNVVQPNPGIAAVIEITVHFWRMNGMNLGDISMVTMYGTIQTPLPIPPAGMPVPVVEKVI